MCIRLTHKRKESLIENSFCHVKLREEVTLQNGVEVTKQSMRTPRMVPQILK